MDSLESSKKIPKLESLSGSISPINTGLNADSSLIRYLRGGSPITFSGGNGNDAFSSPEISAKSCGGSNCSFGRSLSPLSSIENVISPPVYGTPVKVVDEDVLLMDGILVDYLSGGRVSRSTSSGSGGSSHSAASPGIRAYKMEHCRSWEEFGQCRYGSKCQFAHGKEEIRPSFFSLKNDMRTFKSNTSGSSSYSSKSRFLPPVMSEAVAAANPKAISFRPEYKSQSPVVSIKSDYSSKNTSSMHLSKNPTLNKPEVSSGSPIGNIISKYWSPLDDGVDVGLPGYSKKDVDAYITIVLNGPSRRRRLPVFTEFCPE